MVFNRNGWSSASPKLISLQSLTRFASSTNELDGCLSTDWQHFSLAIAFVAGKKPRT